MTTIILSDVHLTNKFDSKKYKFLEKIISNSDQVILNGDFWDGYHTDWETFLDSEWQKLFPLLKSKKTVYIYGNHDKRKFSDDRLNLFSDSQLDVFRMKVGKLTLHIEHGDRIAPSPEAKYRIFDNSFSLKLGHALESLAVTFFGKRFFKQRYAASNRKMKAYVKKKFQQGTILVTGHTHLQEFNLEENYINTGIVGYRFGDYLKIIDDQLIIVDSRY